MLGPDTIRPMPIIGPRLTILGLCDEIILGLCLTIIGLRLTILGLCNAIYTRSVPDNNRPPINNTRLM